MDSQISLQQPILDGGIRSINFFNGRLLSARDLTREQSAYREADRRLGQAMGEGIAYGLEVSKSPNSTEAAPVVTVQSGLAVNRTGQTLMLSAKTEIALVRQPNAAGGAVHPFGECVPVQTGTYVAGAGVYLLTLAPAQSTEGRAITSGLNNGTASCNTDTMVTAVQFRLIQLDPQITAGEMLDQNHLRNLIAYKCFGVSETPAFVSDPFAGGLKRYGLLDSLRPNRLTDCDVPLGILYWTFADGIKFIDMWSVRRPVHRAAGAKSSWLHFSGSRAQAEGEARFLQFQEQISDLSQSTNPRDVAAFDHFHWLPPVGIIPRTDELRSGFDHRRFFQDQTYREPAFVEGAKLEHLIRTSFAYAPMELGSGELIYLYEIRQNVQTVDRGPGVPQAYLIFSSGHMNFAADARFDVSRYDYSNYSTVYD